jgi:hypothetical protein
VVGLVASLPAPRYLRVQSQRLISLGRRWRLRVAAGMAGFFLFGPEEVRVQTVRAEIERHYGTHRVRGKVAVSIGPDKTVYRTTKPEMVTLWDKWEEAQREWNLKVDGFMKEFAPKDCAPMVTNSFGTRVAGITVEGYGSNLPDGWRLDRKHWTLVPFRKTPRGKQIAKAMDGLVLDDPRGDLKGMPSWALIGLSICHPGMQLHNGALYAIWSGAGPDTEGVDPSIWEPVKLSEWYALQENKGEQP